MNERHEPIDLVRTGPNTYREPYEPAIKWGNVPRFLLAAGAFLFIASAVKFGGYSQAVEFWRHGFAALFGGS